MPTKIILVANPAERSVRPGSFGHVTSIEVTHQIGREIVSTERTADVAPLVKAFGDRVAAAHPGRSFIIALVVPRGERKPRGFDDAERTGKFGHEAWLKTIEE